MTKVEMLFQSQFSSLITLKWNMDEVELYVITYIFGLIVSREC